MATRRDFLKSITLVSGALAATKVYGGSNPASKKKMKIGLQLYTLRDDVKTNLPGTLEAVGKIGYNSLEPYGFDGTFFTIQPKKFRKMCNDLGMEITSTHSGITAENASLYTEKAAEAGLEYLILPSFSGRPEKTLDDFKKVAHEMNQIGEITKKSGIKFGYHNHNFEFKPIDGLLPYDTLLSETDPGLVTFEMDIFWVVKGGQDPLHYFKQYPGRFETWHIKDMGMDGQSCIVGNGRINFQDLMKHSEEAGVKRVFVEQEQYSEGTPIYCVEQSYNYMLKHLI